MLLKRFFHEGLAQASYLIGCQQTGEALIVDANRDIGQYIAAAKAGSRAQRVRMVDEALAHERHGFKAAVRVAGEARHGVAVVHAPAVLAAEVAPDLAVLQRHGGREGAVAGGVGIVVVCAEQERVQRRPLRAQQLGADDGGGGRGR